MGLFDDFDVDLETVEADSGGFASIADGTYEFTVAEARRQNGSTNNPDTVFFVVSYDLDEAGQKQDWIVVGNDVDGTVETDERGLGKVKALMLKLGWAAGELNAVEPEDWEGIRGVLTLKTTTSKKTRRDYQNVTIVSVEGASDEPATAKSAPVDEAPAADVKKAVAAKQAARTAPAARQRPARGAAAPAGDTDENPFG